MMKKKILIALIIGYVLVGCSLLNESKISKDYVLNDKYLRGEISFSDDGQYRLQIKKDLFYKESIGTYLLKGDSVFLISRWQSDTVFVSSCKIDSLKSLNIVIEDFDNIPLEGKVVLDKTSEYDFKDGKVIIDKTEWDELWVLTYNYINKRVDTLVLNNKGCNSYRIKRINTFNYHNYIFLNKQSLRLKGKKLVGLSGLILRGEPLNFISRE